jgi:hypothetical protein
VVDIPGGQVGQRAAALVFELDQRRVSRCRRNGLVAARERLQLRLLISADDVFAGVQQPALEAALVEVQDAVGLGLEAGVARKDPRALLPRLQRPVM